MIKIYSWNVNGIRAVLKKELWQPFLDKEQPDIICLQETKAKQEQVELDVPGYEQFWYSAEKPGYSGVALFSKLKPHKVVNGFPQDIIDQFKVEGDTYGDPNKEGRVLAAESDSIWLLTLYPPDANDGRCRHARRRAARGPAL